jgi:hypothetical protein
MCKPVVDVRLQSGAHFNFETAFDTLLVDQKRYSSIYKKSKELLRDERSKKKLPDVGVDF